MWIEEVAAVTAHTCTPEVVTWLDVSPFLSYSWWIFLFNLSFHACNHPGHPILLIMPPPPPFQFLVLAQPFLYHSRNFQVGPKFIYFSLKLHECFNMVTSAAMFGVLVEMWFMSMPIGLETEEQVSRRESSQTFPPGHTAASTDASARLTSRLQ